MPIGDLASITHRITRRVLTFGVTFSIYILDLSFQDPQSDARVTDQNGRGAFKFVALVFILALAHHIFADIRYLLSNIDIGSRLPIARRIAWIVNIAGLAIAF